MCAGDPSKIVTLVYNSFLFWVLLYVIPTGEGEAMKKRVGIWWEKIRAEPWMALLISLLAVLSLIFLTVVIRDDPQWIYPYLGVETTTGKKYEALKLLGISMGGLLLALQALMSYKRAKALEGTVETAERGQRQERLKNAIEHLGHKSDSVRLGGAYELFHLAEDTEDVGQRKTLLDILCAHIRRTTREAEYKKEYPSQPSEEIQSLLILLFVQKHEVFAGLDINLQGSWLNGSNLNRARLEKANLGRTQLHRVFLGEAELHGAHLEEAQLHGAFLVRARLHGAQLVSAQLHGAFLAGARLHGAQLVNAELHGANLSAAELHGANLWNARLHEADLEKARLHGASSDLVDFSESFDALINKRIGKANDLPGAIFAGGLIPEDVDSICKESSSVAANQLREKLKAHIGKPESHKLPEDSGAITGAYTKEEAAQWIAEYKTATSAVSESG